jgi:hypothetical protein
MLAAISGTGSRLLSNFSNPLNICVIYELDRASLEAAGSSVYGSVFVKVRIPLPEVAAEEVVAEEVFVDNKPQLAKRLLKTNNIAIDKYAIFFTIDLPFSFGFVSRNVEINAYLDLSTKIDSGY